MRLAEGTVQTRAALDWVPESLARRPLEKLDAPVLAALRLGLYELLFMSTPDRAAVAESVELVKATTPPAHAFVNAILRRAAREAPARVAGLDDSTAAGAALAHSHPLWVAERWFEELGPDGARSLMRHARRQDPASRRLDARRGRDRRGRSRSGTREGDDGERSAAGRRVGACRRRKRRRSGVRQGVRPRPCRPALQRPGDAPVASGRA